jgi:hypothetical protein
MKRNREYKASMCSIAKNFLRKRQAVLLAVVCLALSGCSDRQSPAAQSYPEAGSAAATLFVSRCGECHAAPQPTSHAAKIWPGVVQRMQMRRRSMSKTPLNQQELATILDYLQRHAAKESTTPEIQ